MPPKKRQLRELTSEKKSEEKELENADKRRDEFIKENLYDSEDVLLSKYTGFFKSDPFFSQFMKKKNVIETGFPKVLEKQKKFQKEEAENREREFFIIHKDDNDDVLLEEYKIFAYNDPYYQTIFSEEKPPTLDYIENQKNYYYRKFDSSKSESTTDFFNALLTEKNPSVLIQKFKEYINRDDVKEILKTKFTGKELTVEVIKNKIEKYLNENYAVNIPIEEHKKKFEIQKEILDILLQYYTRDDFKKQLEEYVNKLKEKLKDQLEDVKNIEKENLEEKYKKIKEIDGEIEEENKKPYIERNQKMLKTKVMERKTILMSIEFRFNFYKDNKKEHLYTPVKIISFLSEIINSGLSDEDLKYMINRYLVDTSAEGSTIYIEDYFDKYLKEYRQNLPEFKEEQKIKKFLREIFKLIKQFNAISTSTPKKQTKINYLEIENKIQIQNKIKEIKDEIKVETNKPYLERNQKMIKKKFMEIEEIKKFLSEIVELINLSNVISSNPEKEIEIYLEIQNKINEFKNKEDVPETRKIILKEINKLIDIFHVKPDLEKEESNKLWIEIQNKIKEFKNEEDAPKSRKEIFDKLDNIKSYSGIELFSNVIKNYLKQYYDLKEGKIQTYKNFGIFLDDFINSAETAFYQEREKKYETLQAERMISRETLGKEKLELEEMSKYDKPISKVLSKEIFDTYNEPVQNDVMDFAKIKLSGALRKVAELPEYDLNSQYIKQVLEHIKNTTTNTYEFLNKVISLITYLSNEVNNVVKFNYKANRGQKDYYVGTNNSFFISNVKKLFYLPRNLAELNPNDMLSNVFYNTSIPEETRKYILQGIQTFIDKTMENSINSIIKTRKQLDNKNIHMRTYKIPAKIYTYTEDLSLKPVLASKLFINIEDNEYNKNVAKSSYKYLLFQDESQNFEYDYVFYNEEYLEPVEIENSDGTKGIFYKPNSEIYRFQNKELWKIIQETKPINPEEILNPYSGRVLNPDFVKEFENVYQTKINEKLRYEEEVEEIKKEEEKKKVEVIREVEQLPDLLELINEDLALIISKKNEPEGATESKSNIERDTGDKIENDKLISIVVNNNKKTYFIILNRDKNDVIKYIYNIHDNSLEKIPDKEKDEVQKSESENFYTLLYFQDSNKKVKPSFTSENNDHALIIESIKDIKNEIKNESGQDITKFLSDITNNTSYSTIDDVKKLKVIFDDKNKPLISFEENKNTDKDDSGETEVVEIIPDSTKKYIAFIYEYKDDKNNTCNNMVIFTKEGFYISSVYDINNEDFIDKDEERGILKSDILKNSTDIKKDLEQFKNNIYSTIYLKKNKLLPCSNELVTKYLEDISKNKNIKGNGNLEKYINELDNSTGVNFDKIEIEIDSEKIPNFRYKGTDCVNNEKVVITKKVETKPETKTETKPDTKSETKSETKSDSDSSSISSDSDGGDSDNESVISTSKSVSSKKVTGSVTCVNCTKEISVNDALKSVVPNKQEEFDTIYFCSFQCFEKYDVWPSVKKIKK